MKHCFYSLIFITTSFIKLFSFEDTIDPRITPYPKVLEVLMERGCRVNIPLECKYYPPKDVKKIIQNSEQDVLFLMFFPKNCGLEQFPISESCTSTPEEVRKIAIESGFHVNVMYREWISAHFEDQEQLHSFMWDYLKDPRDTLWLDRAPLDFMTRVFFLYLTRVHSD